MFWLTIMRHWIYYILIFVVFISGCVTRTAVRRPLTIEYYQQFDYLQLKPFQKSDNKPSSPYIKVLRDSSAYDSIEVHLTILMQGGYTHSMAH